MSPQTQTRLATVVALTLLGTAPAIMTTYPIAAAVCLALGTGNGTAYHVRTPADRAARKRPPKLP
jgi:hypothetical protein